ncbi:FtsW/RodA/SpoVE family cell cycle protein [Naasia lichenicola]|uniref:Probable peptidoglycan glycosyltransferase FtsW n=1 Tax=Naasia lichenicola TaxID=2565933 RepID=A0A4S4FTZ5_9MICO|nr:FtsW/RodA/SpoVE family cell cycle protein [Naasia lichenicola]THG33462.1 cell division protein FtsW [Naasia lichenicola]
MTRTPPAPPRARPDGPDLQTPGIRDVQLSTVGPESSTDRETSDVDARPAGFRARIALPAALAADSSTYVLLGGTTLFLVAFGLVMVLSSSSVESLASGNTFFAAVLTQGMAAALGLPLMLIASRAPTLLYRRIAPFAMLVAMIFQLLVFTPLGFGYGGNRNWLSLGVTDVQPSEFAKLAIILWLASTLAWHQQRPHGPVKLLIRISPVLVLIGLVLAGKDLGTVIVMMAITFSALLIAGVRKRYLATALVAAGALAVIFSRLSESRIKRIDSWLNGCSNSADYLDTCWQVIHGQWALAAGGVLGVGLGNSKAKWSWLPEADNDFIFAVIGEELGLIGAVVVLALFVVLAVGFVRTIGGTSDGFARVATGGIMGWVLTQALLNIGVVLGIFPVLGVPLPLISSGGSSLVSTMVAIGIALSFARRLPSRLDDLPLPGAGGALRASGPIPGGRR